MTRALAEPDFDEFSRAGGPDPRHDDDDLLPQGLALSGRLPGAAAEDDAGGDDRPEAGGRQLHVAETEKYAHVTYFFNGGREQRAGG